MKGIEDVLTELGKGDALLIELNAALDALRER
jgi:hypothetical protein